MAEFRAAGGGYLYKRIARASLKRVKRCRGEMVLKVISSSPDESVLGSAKYVSINWGMGE